MLIDNVEKAFIGSVGAVKNFALAVQDEFLEVKRHGFGDATPVLYHIVSNDIKDVIDRNYDIICFFTPGGVRSLLENFPGYAQNGTKLGAFGLNTFKAAEDAGLTLDIKAPMPQTPGMVSALDKYLQSLSGKKK